MIKSCPNCGGLLATKHMEMFAGTPCNCGYKLTIDLCHNDLIEEIRQLKSSITQTLAVLKSTHKMISTNKFLQGEFETLTNEISRLTKLVEGKE